MHIIKLNEDTINSGVAAFQRYLTAAICGPAADCYSKGMWRSTGAWVLPGVIVACIDRGIATKDELIHAAARASRCRRSTVRHMLSELSNDDATGGLWFEREGRFHLHTDVTSANAQRTRIIMVA